MTAATTTRRHGTRAKYIVEKCKCPPCRAANAAGQKRRAYLNATGRPAYVDATAARARVEQLRAAGMGWRHIAKVAGVASGTMTKLIYGDGPRGMAPSKRITRETERKILAVTVPVYGDHHLIDSTGTRRRLQALVALGWSQKQLAARLGMERSAFNLTIYGEQCYHRTARAARELYDQLWNTPPVADEHRAKIAKARSLRYAREHGWALPMAWDDNALDDPTARPDGFRALRRVAIFCDRCGGALVPYGQRGEKRCSTCAARRKRDAARRQLDGEAA